MSLSGSSIRTSASAKPGRGSSTAAAQRRAAAARAARTSRLRRLALLGGVAVLAAVAIGIWRFDLDDTIEDLTLPLRHEEIIRAEAADPDVAQILTGDIELPPTDPALIAAVIYEESRFMDQTSSQGARGLMQITPDTAETIEGLSGGETFVYEDLADPELNIKYGTFYLRYLLDKYAGDEAAALAAYNAGEGNADEWGGAELETSDITFPETRSYVTDVLEKREAYAEKYADELGV